MVLYEMKLYSQGQLEGTWKLTGANVCIRTEDAFHMFVPSFAHVLIAVANTLQICFTGRLDSLDLMIGGVHLPVHTKGSNFRTCLFKISQYLLDRFSTWRIKELVGIDDGYPCVVASVDQEAMVDKLSVLDQPSF